MDTNARSMFLVTQAELPHLALKDVGGGARIISIIDEAAREPEVNQPTYGASKVGTDTVNYIAIDHPTTLQAHASAKRKPTPTPMPLDRLC
ncbi:hypothetical protein BKA56DRAFT_351934 [Ilyonectria sp. MPI-CAGE-AT-0026]|nr:hypothetical protein BKA56DRAFT_351934 [Ilyonectria sp. MPI-CAGE-AT-0026]